MTEQKIKKDLMFYRFSLYGFLKNLKFFEPFIILIFRDGGLSFLQIGLLYSIRDLGTNILEIPAGVYADAYGRRRAMVMCFIGYILSFVLFFFFTDFYVYALAMLFFASGEALRTGTHKALILEYLALNDMSDLKVGYYGRTRAASQLGSAVNALGAAGLAFYTGEYRYMFLASTVPYVLDLINLWTYPKELDGELASLDRKVMVKQMKETARTFLSIFTGGPALKAILNSASFNGLFKATKDYLQPILESFALSLPVLVMMQDTERSALLIGLVYFCIYLLASYASRSADRFERRFASLSHGLNVSYMLGAGFLLLAGLAAWQDVALFSILVYLGWYLLYNVRRPMTVALVADRIEQRVMASGLSVESQFTTLITAVLAPTLGALADRFGVGAALFAFGAGMLLMARLLHLGESKAPIPKTAVPGTADPASEG